MNPISLVVTAGFMFVAFGAAAVSLLAADGRRRAVRQRFDQVVASYRPARVIERRPAQRRLRLRGNAAGLLLQRALAMDPARVDPYRWKPWMVALPSLGSGYALHWLLQGLLGTWSWLAVPLVALPITRMIYRSSDAALRDRLFRQFPDALAMIVRSVRVGIPVAKSLEAVATDAEHPTALLFARLHDQVTVGTPLEEALRELATRTQVPEYRFFATAISLQSQTGGGLTETLENLADVIRKRVALKARGYALAAEARTSATVLALLPALAGAALCLISPGYVTPLLFEPRGQLILACTIIWLVLGIMVMRMMIRRTLS